MEGTQLKVRGDTQKREGTHTHRHNQRVTWARAASAAAAFSLAAASFLSLYSCEKGGGRFSHFRPCCTGGRIAVSSSFSSSSSSSSSSAAAYAHKEAYTQHAHTPGKAADTGRARRKLTTATGIARTRACDKYRYMMRINTT